MSLNPTNIRDLNYIDLYQEIWRELFIYTNINFLLERIKYNFGIEKENNLVKRKAEHIHYCLKQAKDYFDSARIASLMSQPNLIYYGLISLTSSLIIFRNRNQTLDTFASSHGLTIKYPENSNFKTKEELLNISVEIEKIGSFNDFSKLTLSDRFSIKWEENNIEQSLKIFKKEANNILLPGTSIYLSSLLKMIPEVRKEIEIFFDLNSFIYRGEIYAKINKQNYHDIYLQINKTVNFSKPEHLHDQFSIIPNKYEFIGETGDKLFFRHKSYKTELHIPLIKTDITGTNVVVADKGNNLNLTDFHIYYLTFFILGSIARYKPHIWGYWLTDMKHNINPIAQVLCQSAIIKIPLLMLSELEDSYINIKK